MNRLSFPYGWLLYIGSAASSGIAVYGDVADIAVSMEQGVMNVMQIGSPHPVRVPGYRSLSVQAEMGPEAKMIHGKPANEALGDALQAWPDPELGRAWPPQFRAMAELARRHPEEYHAILATETAAEPLQVVRHSWLDGG